MRNIANGPTVSLPSGVLQAPAGGRPVRILTGRYVPASQVPGVPTWRFIPHYRPTAVRGEVVASALGIPTATVARDKTAQADVWQIPNYGGIGNDEILKFAALEVAPYFIPGGAFARGGMLAARLLARAANYVAPAMVAARVARNAERMGHFLGHTAHHLSHAAHAGHQVAHALGSAPEEAGQLPFIAIEGEVPLGQPLYNPANRHQLKPAP